MKRLFSILLIITLLLTASISVADTREYGLNERALRQVEFGSGVKGTISFDVSGSAPWLDGWQCLTGVPFKLRLIRSDGTWQVRAYAQKDDEAQLGSTCLNITDSQAVLESALLPERKLTINTGGDLLNTLFGGNYEMGTWYSVLLNLLTVPQTTWNSDWEEALNPVYDWLENRLSDFASMPQLAEGENQQSILTVTYTLSADEVKKVLVEMLEHAFAEDDLMYLLRREMTAFQQESYLNPGMLWYYKQLILSLPLDESLILSRQTTVIGENISTQVKLPLAMTGDMGGVISILHTQSGVTQISVKNELHEVNFEMHKTGDVYHGSLKSKGAERQTLNVKFELSARHDYEKDDDTREHFYHDYVLNLSSDQTDTDAMQIDPVSIALNIHQNAKNAQTSPVRSIVNMVFTGKDYRIQSEISLITSSQWKILDLSAIPGEDFMSLTEVEKQKLLSSFLQALKDMCINMNASVTHD